MSSGVDQAFIRRMNEKFETELAKKEKEVLTYWRSEVQGLLKRRHQDLASMDNDLREIVKRMDKRLSRL